MRSRLLLSIALGLASAASAKAPKPYQTGKLLQMDSVQCGITEKDTNSFTGKTLGTDSAGKKASEQLCHEYVVQSERVTYRIRPRDEKHSVLLPIGEQAQFRLQKDRMLLRVEDPDDPYRNNPDRNDDRDNDRKNQEREYIVVSMTPRSESSTADATPSRLNHLQ